MIHRTLRTSLLAVALVALASRAAANDPKPAEQGETVVVPTSNVCVFRLILRTKDVASEEQIKQLMAPYRVVEVREMRRPRSTVVYLVRISCPGDTKGLCEKLLRQDLPENHPDRRWVESTIGGLVPLPDDTTWGSVKK
jgi:hypothetical protein